MATNEWDDDTRPLPGPLPKSARVPPLSTLYDKAAMGTAAATDVARTLIGGPAAMAAGFYQSPLQALSAGPGYLYRKYAEDDPQAADAYWNQSVKPVEENMYSMYKRLAEPSTKQGKQFESDVGDIYNYATGTLKVPHLFPGLTSGIPIRGITPTDVRVMGANAKRIGTQVRDIPTDFRNAQKGLQRIDPVTGESTLGVKLQSTAESVGDTLERQADARIARTDTAGMSPLSAAAAALMPDTSMYIMRPVDSRILRANPPKGAAPLAIPTSTTGSRGDISRADPLSTELNKHTLTYDEMMKPHPLLNTYMAQYARDNNAVHDVGIDTALAQRALEKFPDAPSPSEAILALEAFHGGPTSEGMAKEHMAAADDYAKSPLAAAVATQPGVTPIPTTDEFLKRYEASEKWRTNNFPAFVTKYLGTEVDPARTLAMQGFTFQDPEHVLLAGENSIRTAAKNRAAAGFPEVGALSTALNAKQAELKQKDQEWRAIEDTREARRFEATQIAPLEKEIKNLKLGAAYENMADAAVIPIRVQDTLGVMDYSATQFFPSLTRETNPEALTYKLEKAAIARLGFDDIVDQMHQDILNGKYAPDKVKNISVDRYIRENAEARQKADAAVQALQKAYIDTVTTRFAGMAKDLPADALKYQNAYILESTQKTPVDEVIQRASDDSGVLDNCIGKGSDASQSGKQPKHPFTGLAGTHYEPVFLLDQPGVRNPKAAQDSSAFIKRVISGENILSHVRDETTGFPVANIELKMHRRRDGTQGYTLGYVSGPTTTDGTNGPIDPKYHNAIRDYLNRYADKIGSVDKPLIDNTTIRDTLSGEYDSIGVEAGYRDNKDLRAAYPDLPRFITLDDARAIRNQTYQMPESAASAVPAPLKIAPYEHTDFATNTNGSYFSAENLNTEQRAEARQIVDAIHAQADAEANSHNVLYELPNANSHIYDTPQLRSLMHGSPIAVRAAIEEYFANLPDSQDAPMPRRVASASTEDLRSQITPADAAALTGIEAHIRGELVTNNVVDPNTYFTLLRDAPFSYFGTDVEPEVVELAIRNVADELQVIRQREIAQAQAPAARQAAAPVQVPPETLRAQVTDFVANGLDEIQRAHGEGFRDNVSAILTPLTDSYDYSLGLGPLIAQIDVIGNTQSNAIAAELFDFAQYLREEQHIPPGPAVMPEALGAFEPEAPHPAGPGGVQEVAHHLLEIERRPDGTLSPEGISSTVFALLHGQLDYPGYTQIPPGPERAQAMAPILDAFNTAADNELAIQRMHAATYAQPALPAPEPAGQSLLRTPYNELQQAMTPVERALTMNMQARIASQAVQFGIDGSEVADMIRRRSQTYGGLTVNLDGLSSQALEVLARDTSDAIEAQNRARDRRPRQ